ncbi:MAG: class I SAM-dependent methyltransferase [Chloroflexota bacterium]|nr:MAG: class I SAM-dependent methyltransferase [Chloroflexota bacterium]
MKSEKERSLASALRRLYRRPERPTPWAFGGNLPWNDPVFSKRMLREHLDESHGAASRQEPERRLVTEWLWSRLDLAPGVQVLDVTCGPGLYAVALAERGCKIVGVDFSPASIAYARQLASERNVFERCRFEEADVRQMTFENDQFDAALFLYGQLSVFTVEDALALLTKIASYLRPGGRLVVELLTPDRLDKKDSSWWFTDDTGLWGDEPFLHLGERFWLEEEKIVVERFYTLDLESGAMDEVILCDQSYSTSEMAALMKRAGFATVDVLPAWDELKLYDAPEWTIYVARKAPIRR